MTATIGQSSGTRPLVIARTVRGVADGFVSVLLAQYLSDLGFSNAQIGIIVTGTLIGSAALTLYTGLFWGHHDQRRILLGACVLMAATGFGFTILTTFWPLLVAAVVGTLNPSSGDVSLFLPVEQSAIADRTVERQRPHRFAIYNLAGGLGAAAGALLSPIPGWLARRNDWDEVAAQRHAFALYIVAALIAAIVYRKLSVWPAHERPPKQRRKLGASRGIVLRLAALFSLDSAGGGFVLNAILVLYLQQRFGLDAGAMGLTLAATSVLASFSQLVSARLAGRIGLVNTMVYTHIPANVFLIMAGLSPSAGMAIGFLLLRAALSQMDVPARQALVMRLVPPEERAAAASVTNVPRSLAAATTPALAGWMLDQSVLGWPLVVGGLMKMTYDLLLLAQPLDRD